MVGGIPSFLPPSLALALQVCLWAREELLPGPQHLQEVSGPLPVSRLSVGRLALQDRESVIRRTQASEVAGGLS